MSAVQMLALGFTRDQIRTRRERGTLIPRHRSVFAVGHEALTFRGECIAAQLTIGPDAALSKEAAAHLWTGLPTQPPFTGVTVLRRRPRPREGLRVHETSTLETARLDGLLITTPEQTLHDLRHHPRIEAITAEALFLGLIDRADHPEAAPTRSDNERRLRRLIKAAKLPEPICQFPIGRYSADLAWPDSR